MPWHVDRWYPSRDTAEQMREHYLAEGAAEAHLVKHSKTGSYAVLYAAAQPFTEWHAESDRMSGNPSG